MRYEKAIFIANTPFQCMISLLIQYRLKFNFSSIIITNSMKNSETLQKGIARSDLFDFVELYRMPDSSIASCRSIFCKSTLPESIRYEKYDDLFVCVSCVSHDLENSCFSELIKQNSKLKVLGYVEGYSSYTVNMDKIYQKLSVKHKLINWAAEVFTNRNYIKRFECVFTFYPHLMMYIIADQVEDLTNWEIYKDRDFQKYLFDIFGYSEKNNNIPEKFIFFEESFSEDNGKQEDLELIKCLTDLVGTENLVVKRHPRNRINRFEKMGIKTLANQEIPWEIYALDSNQPEHVLLTHSSGAGLNFRFLTTKSDKTILLYRYYKNINFYVMDDDTKIWFENYERIFEKTVFVPTNIHDLLNVMGTI